MSQTPETITMADRLRSAREKSRLSPEQVAARLELPPETYAAWEAGESEPDTETARRIAALLRVPSNYILFGASRESMVGTMFPASATPDRVPGWYKLMMTGAALLFTGGAAALLMLFMGSTLTSENLLHYLPFQILLFLAGMGAGLCIIAAILRRKHKKEKDDEKK